MRQAGDAGDAARRQPVVEAGEGGVVDVHERRAAVPDETPALRQHEGLGEERAGHAPSPRPLPGAAGTPRFHRDAGRAQFLRHGIVLVEHHQRVEARAVEIGDERSQGAVAPAHRPVLVELDEHDAAGCVHRLPRPPSTSR